MMKWMHKVMALVVCMSLSGACFSGLWRKYFLNERDNENVEFEYRLLKCTAIGYFLPVPLIIKLLNSESLIAKCANPALGAAVFWLWCAGALIGVGRMAISCLRLRRILRPKLPINRAEETLFLDMKSALRINRSVRVCKCYGAFAPCAYGFFRPIVLLPVEDFCESELEIIAFHELSHIKKNDFAWKMLFENIAIIFWFMPLSRLMRDAVCKWSEEQCDALCCRRYSVREYLELFLKINSLCQTPVRMFRKKQGNLYKRALRVAKKSKETL